MELRELLQQERSELRLLEGISNRVGSRIGELRKRIQAMEALEATDNPIPDELFTMLERYLPTPAPVNGHGPFKPVPIDAETDQQTYIVLASIYNAGNPRIQSSTIIELAQGHASSLAKEPIYKVLNRQRHHGRVHKNDSGYQLTPAGIDIVREIAKEKTGEDY
jgi:hypothetical protein